MVTLSHELCMPVLKDFDGATKKPTLRNMHRINTRALYLANIRKDPIPKVESFIVCERSPYFTFARCRFLVSTAFNTRLEHIARHTKYERIISIALLLLLFVTSKKKLYYNGKQFIDSIHRLNKLLLLSLYTKLRNNWKMPLFSIGYWRAVCILQQNINLNAVVICIVGISQNIQMNHVHFFGWPLNVCAKLVWISITVIERKTPELKLGLIVRP